MKFDSIISSIDNDSHNNLKVTTSFCSKDGSLESFKDKLVLEELWRVGVVCQKDCYYVFMEVLKRLERMGYEWKLVSSSYKIKCRKKNEESNNQKQLNILIQVFAVIFLIRFLIKKMNMLLIFISYQETQWNF